MGEHAGRYWSVEECAWVEHSSAPEAEVAEAPEQRLAEDEPALTS